MPGTFELYRSLGEFGRKNALDFGPRDAQRWCALCGEPGEDAAEPCGDVAALRDLLDLVRRLQSSEVSSSRGQGSRSEVRSRFMARSSTLRSSPLWGGSAARHSGGSAALFFGGSCGSGGTRAASRNSTLQRLGNSTLRSSTLWRRLRRLHQLGTRLVLGASGSGPGTVAGPGFGPGSGSGPARERVQLNKNASSSLCP
jgi:hypothetical protein